MDKHHLLNRPFLAFLLACLFMGLGVDRASAEPAVFGRGGPHGDQPFSQVEIRSREPASGNAGTPYDELAEENRTLELHGADVENGWWDNRWDYRVRLSFTAPGVALIDKPVEVPVVFTELLDDLGVVGMINLDSLALLEVDADGAVLVEGAPFQFDPDVDYDQSENASGLLVVLLEGTTQARETRHYDLYFDIVSAEESFDPQPVSARVQTTDNVQDEGFSSIRVETEVGSYYYHKAGGGFASLVDKEKKDWINYNSSSGGAGDFRGIPNLVAPIDGGYFHPGRTFTSNPITSQIVAEGPLKSSFISTTADGAWQVLWEVFPQYAKLTVLRAASGAGYWFLYEGTPGGTFDEAGDYFVASDGSSTLGSGEWETELANEEWVYFAEGSSQITRSLFLVHHQDDATKESYRPDQPTGGQMTVFGFGRQLGLNRGLMEGELRQFTVGLIDDESLSGVRNAIRSAYAEADTIVSSPERRFYYLVVDVTGNGSINVEPEKNAYSYGESVTLEAVPGQGWTFSGWQGNLQGGETLQRITIEGDTEVSAVFEQEEYSLTVETVGEGGVIVTPAEPTYRYGDEVVLEAVPEQSWRFVEWGGDASGNEPRVTLQFTGDHDVSARFGPIRFDSFLPAMIAR